MNGRKSKERRRQQTRHWIMRCAVREAKRRARLRFARRFLVYFGWNVISFLFGWWLVKHWF